MRLYRLTALLFGIFSLAAASAADEYLYDGATLPNAQGWQQFADAGNGTITPQVQPDATTRFTTTTTPGGHTSPYDVYYYATGATNYIASIRLKVLSSSFNSLDAGLMFTTPSDGFNGIASITGPTFRANMLTITSGQVQWGDLGASAVVTGTDFHEYAIRHLNNKLDIYVDATYADIQSGAATPVLSRTLPAFTNPGVIVFGDQTNDANIDSDYYVAFVKFQSLDIAAAVTSSGSSTYGDSVTFTATLSNASNPTGTVTFCADDSTCAAPTWSCTAPVSGTSATCSTAILAAGNHSITASYVGDANNDPVSTASALSQAVVPAPLTITADNQSKVYGAALPTLTASYSGFVNGDTTASLGVPPTLTSTATAASHVAGSPYSIAASGAVDPDYTISYVPGSLNVSPAPLTIIADNQSKIYGSALPTLTASYSGFVNGDNAASLSTPPTLTSTVTNVSHVSGNPYAITASGATDADYLISYVAGSLAVTTAPLTIIADNKSRAYGQPNPPFTVTYSGLINGDSASSFVPPVTITSSDTPTSPTGTYTITPGGAVDPDYTITFDPGTLTIGLSAQTITFTSTSPAHTSVGGATYTPSATSSSGLAVTFSIDAASTSGACTLAGNTVSFLATGTCIVDANQAGNANYNAATQAQQTVTIGQASQTVTITSTAPAATVGGATYTPTATSTSGLVVTLTIDASSTAGACTISGGVVSFTGAGNCIVDANQAGNANFAPAPTAQQAIAVSAAAAPIEPAPLSPWGLLLLSGLIGTIASCTRRLTEKSASS